MQEDNYKESLKATIDKLIAIRGELFNCMLEVAMQGELKEWNESVPVGEEMVFSKELFEGCTDNNIQLIVKLVKEVEGTCDTMCNLNSIPFPIPDENDEQ